MLVFRFFKKPYTKHYKPKKLIKHSLLWIISLATLTFILFRISQLAVMSYKDKHNEKIVQGIELK
jgi:hypothetical protein